MRQKSTAITLVLELIPYGNPFKVTAASTSTSKSPRKARLLKKRQAVTWARESGLDKAVVWVKSTQP